MRFVALSLAATCMTGAPAFAAELSIRLEIPRLAVAEYHKPYVAIWLENKAAKSVTNLAVWYDFKMRDHEGTKWLKDMRQWWRVSGRELKMPVDGITGATRAPGRHSLTFKDDAGPLKGLSPGNYVLTIEAAREVGGRELLRIPIEWPPAGAAEKAVAGKHELGSVEVAIKP